KSCTTDAPGQIDIFEVGVKVLGEAAEAAEHLGAIESARCTGAEDITRHCKAIRQRFAMSTLAREAAQIIFVAGTVDDRSRADLRSLQNQRSDSGNLRIGEATQCGVRPTSRNL